MSTTTFPKKLEGECTICSNGPVTLVTLSSRCTHQPAACVECYTRNISQDITSKGAHRFTCPMATCRVEFEPEEYYHLLDKRLIDIVDKLLLHRTLETMEEFRWCKSDKGCGAGQLVSNHADLLGYYTCHKCDIPLCFRHSIKWHQGYTCAEFDTERAKNPDLASDVTVLAFSKQCPNEKCKTPIMKLEGCDVMTCCRYGTHLCAEAKDKCDHGGKNYCGTRFCWKCLGKMELNKRTGGWIRKCKQNCEYATLNG